MEMEFQDNRPAQGALRKNHSSNIFISMKYTNKYTESPLHILKYFSVPWTPNGLNHYK
jgi:hypothetical protein